jgi:hypothetical protein
MLDLRFFNVIIIKLIIFDYFLVIFDKVHLLFRIRIRIHNLKLRIRIRIRILQKGSDPYGSGFGSTTLAVTKSSN